MTPPLRAWLLATAVLLAACGQVGEPAPPPTAVPAAAPNPESAARVTRVTVEHPDGPQLMGLAVREILAANTGATTADPLATVYVQAAIDLTGPMFEDELGRLEIEPPPRPLAPAERQAIESAIADLAGSVEFVESDPLDWDALPDSVMLSTDRLRVDGNEVVVPVALYCGLDCAFFGSYVFELADGQWGVQEIRNVGMISPGE